MRALAGRRVAVVLLGGLLIAGGGLATAQTAPEEATGDDRTLIAEALAAPLPAEAGPDEGGEGFQREVFRDGVVTFDEYERAVLEEIRGIERKGFAVEGPYRYPEGPVIVFAPGEDPSIRLNWVVVAPDEASEERRLERVMLACEMQWRYRIENVWLAKHGPSEAEVDAWLQRLADCAREHGLSVSLPPTADEQVQAIADGCRPWEMPAPAGG
jgi:hypothetical protein